MAFIAAGLRASMALNSSSVSETGRPEACIAASKACRSQGLPLGVVGVGKAGLGSGALLAAALLVAKAGPVIAGRLALAVSPAINPRRLSVSKRGANLFFLQARGSKVRLQHKAELHRLKLHEAQYCAAISSPRGALQPRARHSVPRPRAGRISAPVHAPAPVGKAFPWRG